MKWRNFWWGRIYFEHHGVWRPSWGPMCHNCFWILRIFMYVPFSFSFRFWSQIRLVRYTLYKWFKFYHLIYIGRVFFFHLLTQKKSFDIFSNLPVIKWFKAIKFAQMHIFPFVSSLTNTKDCDVRFRTFLQFILWRSRHRKS